MKSRNIKSDGTGILDIENYDSWIEIDKLKSKNILEPKRNKSSNYNLKHNYI